MAQTSIKDRTREFVLTVQSARSHVLPTSKPNNNSSNNSADLAARRKRFSAKAAQIGKDIHRTADKLAKLTKLAKSKSLFDDPAAEISELSFVITQDLQRLNEDLDELGHIHELENLSNGQSNDHASAVKRCLQSNLKNTAESFASVLQIRSENMQLQQTRRNEYSSASSFANKRGPDPSFMRGGGGGGGGDEGIGGGEVVIELGGQQLMQEQYSESRALSVQDIERSIGELAGVFQKLGDMVSLQQEQIERIDTNMEDALQNVDAGHGELLKYYHTMTGNRALMFKIFGVLIFSLILLVIFGT